MRGRVLFLVDRANLGRQTLKEFQAFTTPDDGRKFTELYNVQHLSANAIDPSRVVISTIQRLYSILQGEPELDSRARRGTRRSSWSPRPRSRSSYNPTLPIEAFDVIIVDECHRSIYGVWRQVLDYFDAFLIGLTATPASRPSASSTRTSSWSTATTRRSPTASTSTSTSTGSAPRSPSRGRRSTPGSSPSSATARPGRSAWEKLDEDVTYDAGALDRAVVAKDQIRTVIRTFRERLFTEIFPGATHVPKTLIFAKDDSHADDIVQIVREEFGKGNDFAAKITYQSDRASAPRTCSPRSATATTPASPSPST